MKVTPNLRKYLSEKFSMAQDATDEVAKSLATEKLMSGELTAEKLAELTTDNAGKALEDAISKALDAKLAPIMAKLSSPPASPPPASPPDETKQAALDEAAIMAMVEKTVTSQVQQKFTSNESGNASDIITKSAQIHTIKAVDRYDGTSTGVMFPADYKSAELRGQPVIYGGKHLHYPSAKEKAVNGAYIKWCFNVSAKAQGIPIPRAFRLTDHDIELFKYALNEMEWDGMVGSPDPTGRTGGGSEAGARKIYGKLSEFDRKAILDDGGASGGLEAAPIVFDDMVIITPILNGELFPLVGTITLERGRRVEGFSIGNPTFTSGTAEGTPIGLFDTSGLIAAFDTTIYPAVGAMEIGLDFEEDSPNNITAIVSERYGEQAKNWLDEQIAIGDGTTEPKGLFNTSGTVAVSSTNTTGGPLTVSDLERLQFGVTKEYRKAKGGRCVYVSNEVTYRRGRAIKVGTTDERRIMGMNYQDYMTLGFSHRINHEIPNNQLGFANMGFYRMYRRAGLSLRVERAGKTLALSNLLLLVLRMRWGGQLELGGAFAEMNDAPSSVAG